MLDLCSSQDENVRLRAVGSVHNISTDPVAVSVLLSGDGSHCLDRIVPLLRDSCTEICRASAGTLQNLARDTSAREVLAVYDGAVAGLVDLLLSADMHCQVAAVGALVNILGPTLPATSYDQFKSLLADAVAFGAIRSSIFDN